MLHIYVLRMNISKKFNRARPGVEQLAVEFKSPASVPCLVDIVSLAHILSVAPWMSYN